METLCFTGNYIKRFARVKEFSNEIVEFVLDEFLQKFCNSWLESEFELECGARSYERNERREDIRAGHYHRRLLTSRGMIELSVPRGVRKKYKFSLFKHYRRYTPEFERVVLESIVKGHSSRKASSFFGELFGQGSVSHQTAVSTLRKFDTEIEKWQSKDLRDDAVILLLDAIHLKGVIPYLKQAKPVLFAYAIYADGKEEVLDFELARGESITAWSRFCQKIYNRGLKNVKLVVHDDNSSIGSSISFVWPEALDQQCVFHMLKNMRKKLKGCVDKNAIMDEISSFFESFSEKEFNNKVCKFIGKWKRYLKTDAFKYLFNMLPDCTKYFNLPQEYWAAAKTSNRLERLFEELRRRIDVFRRFPNQLSCKRWLYALLVELNKTNMDYYTLPK